MQRTMIAIAMAAVLSGGAATARAQNMGNMRPDTLKVSGDAGVLAAVAAIDSNEIKVAQLALTKKVSDKVADLAKDIRKDHDDNAESVEHLTKKMRLAPTDTGVATAIKQQGNNDIAQLQPLTGSAFERAYIDAIVKGHSDALAVIDNKLMAAAVAPDVKDLLKKTRDDVQKHLDKAKSLQAAPLR